MLNQSVQEISYSEPSHLVEHSETEIHSDINIIPCSQYLIESQTADVQDTNSSAQQDALILSVFEQLSKQVTNCNKLNNDNIIANETLSAELERYKERKQALGFQNSFCLKKAQLIRPMIYDGDVIAKETNVISIADSEKTLMLEEENFGKRFVPKRELSDEQALHPIIDQYASLPVKIEAPRELPKVIQIVLWYLDSICSKHMTGDRSQLTNFVHKFLGTVKLGNGQVAKIMRNGLVHGLPRLKFEKEHLCYACAMGKNKKQSHKPKSEDTNQEKLYLLHMDLCGPMCVASVNGKKYILVIVDDYSQFTWVKFLALKDEAPDFIIKFLKMIQVRLNATLAPPLQFHLPQQLLIKMHAYKPLCDSVKPLRIRAKEHAESLVNQQNQKSIEITDLNAQLQEKAFVVTVLKMILGNSKEKT
nr:ribonuclease H-like domain-containing protein [Tanacetum cinerariifolium]